MEAKIYSGLDSIFSEGCQDWAIAPQTQADKSLQDADCGIQAAVDSKLGDSVLGFLALFVAEAPLKTLDWMGLGDSTIVKVTNFLVGWAFGGDVDWNQLAGITVDIAGPLLGDGVTQQLNAANQTASDLQNMQNAIKQQQVTSRSVHGTANLPNGGRNTVRLVWAYNPHTHYVVAVFSTGSAPSTVYTLAYLVDGDGLPADGNNNPITNMSTVVQTIKAHSVSPRETDERPISSCLYPPGILPTERVPQGDVTIRWAAPDGCTPHGYIVRMSFDGLTEDKVFETVVTANSYTIAGVDFDTDFYWHVAACEVCPSDGGIWATDHVFVRGSTAPAGSLYFSAWWNPDERGTPHAAALFQADPLGQTLTQVLTYPDLEGTRSVSPDGQRQVWADEGTVAMFDTASGRRSASVTLPDGEVPEGGAGGAEGVSFSWMADGSSVIVTNSHKDSQANTLGTQFILFDSTLARGRVLFESTGNQITGSPSISPDGNKLAFSRDNSALGGYGIWVQHQSTAEPVLRSKTLSQYQRTVAWAPDGDHLAFFEQGDWRKPPYATMYEWTLVTMRPDGSEYRILKDFTDTIEPGLSWSPDGARIAVAAPTAQDCCSLKGLTGNLFSVDAQSGNVVRVAQFQTTLESQWSQRPAWSPDDQYVAYLDAETADGHSHPAVVAVSSRERYTIAAPDGGFASEPVWAP